jgi:hypothetical protein
LAAVAVAWLHARSGRKVRLKFGDVEAEARTPEEVEQLLDRLACFRNEASQPVSHTERQSSANPVR